MATSIDYKQRKDSEHAKEITKIYYQLDLLLGIYEKMYEYNIWRNKCVVCD